LFRKQLDQVRRQDVKEFLRRLARRRSPALVESVHGVISAVFNEAVDEALINANPVTGISKGDITGKKPAGCKAA
jgi:transcriptional regulator of NAD metabolism